MTCFKVLGLLAWDYYVVTSVYFEWIFDQNGESKLNKTKTKNVGSQIWGSGPENVCKFLPCVETEWLHEDI